MRESFYLCVFRVRPIVDIVVNSLSAGFGTLVENVFAFIGNLAVTAVGDGQV